MGRGICNPQVLEDDELLSEAASGVDSGNRASGLQGQVGHLSGTQGS